VLLLSEEKCKIVFTMLELLADENVLCTRRQLATILHCTSRQIDALTFEKVLKPVRCSKVRGKAFKLAESVSSYLDYVTQRERKQSRNGNSEYESARTRRMAALAETEESRARQISGEYVRRDHVVFVMTRGITQAKNHLLGLPARLPRVLAGQCDPVKIRQILDTAIRNCLTEVSKIGSHSFDEHGKMARDRESDDE
jgi:hypothetical protein